MVQQSDVLKQFLAGTNSNQFLNLIVFWNQKRLKIPKIMVSQRIRQVLYWKFHFKILKDKVVVYDFSLLCGNHYHSFSHVE